MPKASGFKFGDTIENGWASEDNPTRVGFYIRTTKRGVEMTNGNGDVWTVANDDRSRFALVAETSPLRSAR